MAYQEKSTFTAITVIAFFIFLIVIGPVLTLWAWNVLFGSLYTIPLTFETWIAVVLLGSFFRATVKAGR